MHVIFRNTTTHVEGHVTKTSTHKPTTNQFSLVYNMVNTRSTRGASGAYAPITNNKRKIALLILTRWSMRISSVSFSYLTFRSSLLGLSSTVLQCTLRYNRCEVRKSAQFWWGYMWASYNSQNANDFHTFIRVNHWRHYGYVLGKMIMHMQEDLSICIIILLIGA